MLVFHFNNIFEVAAQRLSLKETELLKNLQYYKA